MEGPDSLYTLFTEWIKVHPTFVQANPSDLYDKQMEVTFLITYELPWIWHPKWKIQPSQENIPALWRTYEVQRWRNFHTAHKFPKAIKAIKADLTAWTAQKPVTPTAFEPPAEASIAELKAYYLRKVPQAFEEEVMTFCVEHLQQTLSQQMRQHFSTALNFGMLSPMSTGTSNHNEHSENEDVDVSPYGQLDAEPEDLRDNRSA